MVSDIANIKIHIGAKLNAMGLLQFGLFCGPTVSGITWLSGSSDGGDLFGSLIDFANGMVLHIDDVQVPFGVKTDFVREVQGSL